MADEARKRTKPWAVQLYDFIVGDKPTPAPKPAAKPKLREKAKEKKRPTQSIHKGQRKMMKEVEF